MFLRNISNPCAETSSLNFGCRICACSTSILTVRTTDLVMAGGSLNCDTRWSSSAMRLAGMAASIEVHRISKNAFRVDLFRMLWIRVRIINFLLRIEFGSKNAKGSPTTLLYHNLMLGNRWWEGNMDLNLPKRSLLKPHPQCQKALGSWKLTCRSGCPQPDNKQFFHVVFYVRLRTGWPTCCSFLAHKQLKKLWKKAFSTWATNANKS